MKEYKITFWKVLNQVKGDILTLCLLVGIIWFLTSSPSVNKDRLLGTYVIILSGILPGLIYPLFIHINHYRYDKKTKLTIDRRHKKIFYVSEDVSKEFMISDITYIKKHGCVLSAFTFGFSEIYLQDRTRIFVTYFAMPFLDKELKHIKRGYDRYYDLRLFRWKKNY
ncbi:hypothetical protein M2138_001964 [Dysgonomonadaceae bacterium PH5-43]|nr:hypothetical protein [Dysgonomonadaceae bacterium PH5-43]